MLIAILFFLLVWLGGAFLFIILDGIIGFKPEISDDELPLVAAIWPISSLIILVFMGGDLFAKIVNWAPNLRRLVKDLVKTVKDSVLNNRS